MPELPLNGVLEEEVGEYYHICFFIEKQGLDRDNPDHYIFVPKPVCRIIDSYTIGVQDWYARKKGLDKFIKQFSAKTIQRAVPKSKPVTVADQKKALAEAVLRKLAGKDKRR